MATESDVKTAPLTKAGIIRHHLVEAERCRESLASYDAPMHFGYVSPEQKEKAQKSLTAKIAFHEGAAELLMSL